MSASQEIAADPRCEAAHVRGICDVSSRNSARAGDGSRPFWEGALEGCCWPSVRAGRSTNRIFCANPLEPGSQYCAYHTRFKPPLSHSLPLADLPREVLLQRAARLFGDDPDGWEA